MPQPETYSLPFVKDDYGCSRQGAEHALPAAGSQALKVWTAIRDHGPVTDRELVALTGFPINVICARRWALAKQGRIQAMGVRVGASQVPNTIWVAVEK